MSTQTPQEVAFEIRDDLHGKVVGEGKGTTHFEGNPSAMFAPQWVTYEGKDYLLYTDVEGAKPYIIVKK
ncbi:MAG: hypothetical protein PVF51_07400 [Nitrospirota bacterium]|jgi:hypothetical protein